MASNECSDSGLEGRLSHLSGSKTELQAQSSQQATHARRRLLIVDDDETVAVFYHRALTSQGYDVVSTRNGSQALDLVRTSSFDAVLSDISMPEMDGIQLLKSVRKLDLDLPVILVTGEPHLDTAIQALRHGALRYLLKPVKTQELLDVVAHAIQIHDLAKIQKQALELMGDRNRAAVDRKSLDQTFADSLVRLWMAYQPIVSWLARDTFAYEALVRSEHPQLSNPAVMFDAAFQLERIFELGRTIRQRVAQDVGSLQGRQLVFVNLHPHELEDDLLYGDQNPLILFADRIVLEITERAALDGVSDLRDRLARLRSMGFRLAVDDLGSGYAGLASFVQLDPEIVKIDMSLVRNIHRNGAKQKLVQSMIQVCRDMRIDVVTEGVETQEERATLVALGADLMQGYLFAAPSEPFVTIPRSAFEPR
jgi:EAL domain-containing protein (putative c-di-GMP-specific phosphodiesterase class I)